MLSVIQFMSKHAARVSRQLPIATLNCLEFTFFEGGPKLARKPVLAAKKLVRLYRFWWRIEFFITVLLYIEVKLEKKSVCYTLHFTTSRSRSVLSSICSLYYGFLLPPCNFCIFFEIQISGFHKYNQVSPVKDGRILSTLHASDSIQNERSSNLYSKIEHEKLLT